MKTPESVSISVVIPAFNAAHYLPEALASVIAESDFSLQIIVVDDGSTDATADIAMAYADRGVVLLRHERQCGIGAARNRGIARADGSHLAFIDADDRWPAGRLQKLMAVLDGPEGPDIAFGHTRQFLCPQIEPERRRQLSCPAGPMPGYSAGAMLLRLDDFRHIGPFDEQLKLGEFISWFARAREGGARHALIDDIVLERRIHGANHTIHHRQDYGDYLHVLKRSLDRRRAGGGV